MTRHLLVRSQSAIKRNVGAEAVSIFLLKIVYYCLIVWNGVLDKPVLGDFHARTDVL